MFPSRKGGHKVEYFGKESAELSGVGVVGERKNSASRKMLAPLKSRRASGRALWLNFPEWPKSRAYPIFRGVPFTVGSPSGGSVGSS